MPLAQQRSLPAHSRASRQLTEGRETKGAV
jgi:hypothetical protein